MTYDVFVPNAPLLGYVTLPTPVHILLVILNYHIGIFNLIK